MREHVLNLIQKYIHSPLKPTGAGNYQTKCPFHKGGQERKPSFSINPEKGVFRCFTCQESGDIRRLLMMLGLPRQTIQYEIQPIQAELEKAREIIKTRKSKIFQSGEDLFKSAYEPLPEALLGVFEYLPLTLVEKGFKPELLYEMEVGFDIKNNRITYPIRDLYGNLAGISGGAIYPTQTPKYKVYQGKRIAQNRVIPGDFGDWFDEQFPSYTCENHNFLWNYHRVYPRLLRTSESDATLFIVEGFKACLWLIQHGYLNTVALMGSYISEVQQWLLQRLGVKVVLCLDNDPPGRSATIRVGNRLWRPMQGQVDVLVYPSEDENTQPDDYSAEELKTMIDNRIHFTDLIDNQNRKRS